MKKASIIIFCIGLLASFFFGGSTYMTLTGDGLGGGYGLMLIGYPLVFIGIVLFIISLFVRKNH